MTTMTVRDVVALVDLADEGYRPDADELIEAREVLAQLRLRFESEPGSSPFFIDVRRSQLASLGELAFRLRMVATVVGAECVA